MNIQTVVEKNTGNLISEPLATERLILRDFQSSDREAVYTYSSDAEAVRHMDFGPDTPEDSKQYISKLISWQEEKPRKYYDLAVCLKSENAAIGSCGIHVDHFESQEGELGYILIRRYWRQGYATEAAGKMLDFGFNQLGLHRIYATTDIENLASIRVLEKLGMRREGCIKEAMWVPLFSRWVDCFLYAMLEKEFREISEM